ncbi:MAG TPA: DUF6788 family protein [Ktedonobacteraceae bacterium]|nr:DUF6788 family protein [Ktedonobacteraceae bacterium]
MNGKVTYRQQFARCGKAHCRKCQEGAGHGPYWYAYWNEQGSTVSKYIGARLPTHIAELQQDNMQEITTYIPTINSSSPGLRIYLLGQFRIERCVEGGWQTIDSHMWHRRRARALLGCLLSNPGHRLGREQVMEQLWPDLEATVAANRLNGAVHELRQMLEPDIARPATSRLLRLQRDMLELANSTEIWVDTEAFEHLLKEAHATSDTQQAERLLEEASALYQGSYLEEELYAEWAASRRDTLQRAWVELLLMLANTQIAQEAKFRALDTLDRLRAADPTNEVALQRLMVLLTHLDRRGEALQLYQQHRATLKQDYECEPVAETIRLYEQLRQGHVPHLHLAHDSQDSISTKKQLHNASKQLPLPAALDTTTTQTSDIMRPGFPSGRHYQSPLIGREHELDLMRHLLQTVAAGIQAPTDKAAHPRFILLRGEAGIGKTRLAEELSLEADTHGWAIAWHKSYEHDGNIPYHLWTQILRILLSSAEATQPALNEQERHQRWATIGNVLQTLSMTYPLLLVFDDLHWADDNSIELFIYLLQHLQTQRILFIATYRDGEIAPRHALHTLIQYLQREQTITTITLNPLTPEQIGTMVSYLPKDAVVSIQQQASGNPFFAEELARYMESATVRVQSIDEHAKRDPALPEAIAAVLDRRLAKLSHDCQQLLGKAAVLGNSFALQQLLPMSTEQSEERVLDLLDEALQASLLREEGAGANITYHFWHPLIINHLYSRLSATRKAQLHRRLAQTRQTST